MKFIPDPDRLSQTAAEDYQCDEWPPASAEKPDYASKTNFNSPRCMKSIENQKLGTQLGTIYGGHRANTAGKKAKMDPGDYFKVTLNTNGADMTKLQYTGANPSCTNDGMQFQMTKRPNKGGLITPGAPTANDNEYTLHGEKKPVGMCSIDFHRVSDEDFTNICVTDEANKDCTTGGKATIRRHRAPTVSRGSRRATSPSPGRAARAPGSTSSLATSSGTPRPRARARAPAGAGARALTPGAGSWTARPRSRRGRRRPRRRARRSSRRSSQPRGSRPLALGTNRPRARP